MDFKVDGNISFIKYYWVSFSLTLLETLEWLKLGENQLQEIPREALQNLSKLRELDLRGNHITVVPLNAFDNYSSNIKFLYLQKNKYSCRSCLVSEGVLLMHSPNFWQNWNHRVGLFW